MSAGYAMAMGALLGACVQLAVFIVRLAYHAAMGHRWPPLDPWGLIAMARAVGITSVLGGIVRTSRELRAHRSSSPPLWSS
jgi:hypothetical protein